MTQGLRVGDLGEFGLIDRLATLLGPSRAVVGIGDDTAVIDLDGPEYLLATVDMLVEGVHFQADIDGLVLGRRAMAVNLSDIAAMGGAPIFALVSIALPSPTLLEFVDRLYLGLQEQGRRFGAEVVGGNVTSTPGPFAIDVVLVGRVPRDEVILREGAQPDDRLLVSGSLGGPAARRLLSGRESAVPPAEPPEPRIALARALATLHLAHAGIDLSDGLGSDLHHLAARSSVGAVLYEDRLPISSSTRRIAQELGTNATELALYGGEDYELLFAVPPDRINDAIEAAGGVPLHDVGRVLEPQEGVVLERADGTRAPLEPRGWTHF